MTVKIIGPNAAVIRLMQMLSACEFGGLEEVVQIDSQAVELCFGAREIKLMHEEVIFVSLKCYIQSLEFSQHTLHHGRLMDSPNCFGTVLQKCPGSGFRRSVLN